MPRELEPRFQFRATVSWPDDPSKLGLDSSMWPDATRTVATVDGCMRLVAVACMLRSLATETRTQVVYAALAQQLDLAEQLLAAGPVGRVADRPADADDDRHGDREA